MYCIVLYCIVLYCIVLYCIVLYCIVLYCPVPTERPTEAVGLRHEVVSLQLHELQHKQRERRLRLPHHLHPRHPLLRLRGPPLPLHARPRRQTHLRSPHPEERPVDAAAHRPAPVVHGRRVGGQDRGADVGAVPPCAPPRLLPPGGPTNRTAADVPREQHAAAETHGGDPEGCWEDAGTAPTERAREPRG